MKAFCIIPLLAILISTTLAVSESPMTEEEEYNLLIKIDIHLAATRGLIQGLKRGFYQQYSFELKPNCFGEESEILLYKTYEIIEYEIWSRLYELPGYIYDLYLIADSECELEENIYDLMVICDTHNCTLERVVENESDSVFEITGVINSALAIYYMDTT